MAFKLSKGKGTEKAGKGAKGAQEKRSLLDMPLPLIGRLAIATQIKLLGSRNRAIPPRSADRSA